MNPKDFDIIIGLKVKEGKLFGPSAHIYAHDGKALRQIGLIEEFKLEISVNDIFPKCQVKFVPHILSETAKELVEENARLLTEKGCSVQ